MIKPQMIDYLIDNNFVQFDGLIFRKNVVFLIGTKFAIILFDFFLYEYEAEFF